MITVEIMDTGTNVDVDIPGKEPEVNAAIEFEGETLKIGGNGLSAYEIALEHGFEGSEEEWLESLKGKDGYTPVKGVDFFTESDKSDMVSAVIAALPVYNGEVVSV